MANQLSDAAENQLANKTETGKDNTLIEGDKQAGKQSKTGHQTHLKQAIESLERGTNTDKEGKGGNQDQAGQQGILLASAPQGIAIATPQSATLTTGTNFDQVSQRDTNQTTGRRWIHNVGESISLFVVGNTAKIKESIKLIAAKGKIQVQAQSDEVEITADKQIEITSAQASQLWNGKKNILLTCGGAYIKIEGGGIQIHAPGKVTFKAANHDWSGPASFSPPIPPLPKGEFNDCPEKNK